MRRLISFSFVLVLSLIHNTASADDARVVESARTVIREHCYQCHNGPGSSGGDLDFLDRSALIENGLVEPGNSAESHLLERILDESMPPMEQRERNPVTEADREVLRSWIEAGAPELKQEMAEKDFLSLEKVLQSVRDYLRGQDEVDRPFLRFFTLHHLYNSPRTNETDLPLYRAALSKALNSMSWNPDIVLPQAIDEGTNALHGTVFAIDLRTLVGRDGRTWAELNHWNSITKKYPYGLSYPDFREDDRQKLLKQIARLIDPKSGGTRLPLLRVDWFVSTATRPPLYHTLLDLPNNAKELEQQLGVDIATALLQPTTSRIARAGFAKSGVSGQNRLLERSRAKHGFYWKSYDFLPDAKTANLVRFPLGPLNTFPPAEHPFKDQAFEHDGGEIIFTLPNGLQAYLLVDGEDQRIDVGPIEVVSDALKTSGTPAIINGLSCMACHREGMIDFADEIRNGSGVFGNAADHVQRLYPTKEVMQKLVDKDRKQFLEALEKATMPFWNAQGSPEKSITRLPEPVSEVARLYRFVYLDAETIAAELDFKSPAEIIARTGVNPIKELGLKSVFNSGGGVSRNVWEASDGLSLMQDLAFEAGMTPVR